jgi:hypothetical protein
MSMIVEVVAASPGVIERLHAGHFEELSQQGSAAACSLEKAWHGLHYLLTGGAWDAPQPLGFIVAGGTEIEDSDSGYGPARSFTPQDTRAIGAALGTISDQQLWSRFNAEEMMGEGVYPTIWDEPEDDLRDEYTMYFNQLKQFVAEAAARGDGLVVTLS